jgi:heme ABC exporter ATP-binding subunit CcmA
MMTYVPTVHPLSRDCDHRPLLIVEEVHKTYGPTPVLQGLSLQVTPGEVLGLVGANGAGKTTLLRLVAALTMPDSGCIRVLGNDTTHRADAVRQQVGTLLHQSHLYEDLTPEENLRFWSTMSGRELDPEALTATFARLGLTPYRQQRVRTLSHGTKKRIALVRVMLGQAPVLLLDEPYSGLDASASAAHDELLDAHRRQGGSALLVSHHLAALHRVCDRLALLAEGRLVLLATTAEISVTQLQSELVAASAREDA